MTQEQQPTNSERPIRIKRISPEEYQDSAPKNVRAEPPQDTPLRQRQRQQPSVVDEIEEDEINDIPSGGKREVRRRRIHEEYEDDVPTVGTAGNTPVDQYGIPVGQVQPKGRGGSLAMPKSPLGQLGLMALIAVLACMVLMMAFGGSLFGLAKKGDLYSVTTLQTDVTNLTTKVNSLQTNLSGDIDEVAAAMATRSDLTNYITASAVQNNYVTKSDYNTFKTSVNGLDTTVDTAVQDMQDDVAEAISLIQGQLKGTICSLSGVALTVFSSEAGDYCVEATMIWRTPPSLGNGTYESAVNYFYSHLATPNRNYTPNIIKSSGIWRLASATAMTGKFTLTSKQTLILNPVTFDGLATNFPNYEIYVEMIRAGVLTSGSSGGGI